MKELTPAQRLVVAADVPNPALLAMAIRETGVVFKENATLRKTGYCAIRTTHNLGLQYCADLKLNDIGNTMRRDGELLQEARPEIVTVMCGAPMKALEAIRKAFPETELWGVTVLTDMDEEECFALYNGRSLDDQVRVFVARAMRAGLDGVVCSPKEIGIVKDVAGENLTINTPAVRPAWLVVPGDDQNQDRVLTPTKAIARGADRIVVGRPIVLAPDPHDAVMRTIDEIARAVEQRTKGVAQ